MSLLASQALITNQILLSRVAAAVRKTAAARLGWSGSAGALALAAYRAPETVLPGFMLRMATNQDMVTEACPSCGHVEQIGTEPVDSTIEWIVGDAWHAVATELYGADEDPPAA